MPTKTIVILHKVHRNDDENLKIVITKERKQPTGKQSNDCNENKSNECDENNNSDRNDTIDETLMNQEEMVNSNSDALPTDVGDDEAAADYEVPSDAEDDETAADDGVPADVKDDKAAADDGVPADVKDDEAAAGNEVPDDAEELPVQK
ncbi:ribonuclease E-like isoform X3 [Maniola hyperantus]